MLFQEDCITGNSQLQLHALPIQNNLQYRIQDKPYQENPVLGNLPTGLVKVYVQDSVGCVDSSSVFLEDEKFPKIDTVNVTSCDSTNGIIRLVHSRSASAWEYSIDDGRNWQSSNSFNGLAAGNYYPAVRKSRTGCIVKGDSIRLGDTCSTLPLAAFQDSVIYLTSPDQVLNVKWEIDGKPIFTKGVDLLLRMEGNGLPHFGERYLTTRLPELRSDNDRRYPYQYPNGHSRADSLRLPMGDSAQYYTYPKVYFFHLEKPIGAAVKIDPKRAKLRVVVNLNTPPVETYKTLYLCPDDECITIGEDNPVNCTSWQDEPNEDGSRQICRPTDPQKDYVQYRLNDQFEVVEIIHYKIIELNFTVSIKPDTKNPQGCKGMPLKLNAELNGLDPARAAYLWSNGETTASISLPSPTPGITIGVTVTDQESDCIASASYEIPNSDDNACKLYDYFKGKGFYAIKITVTGRTPQATRPELRGDACANNDCAGASGICISDRSNGITFDLRGAEVAVVADHVRTALNAFKAFDYNNGKGLITENEGMCDCEGNENLLSSTEQRFEESELGYWLHVWEKGESDCGDSDILFIKAKLPGTSQYSPGEDTSPEFLDAALNHLNHDLGAKNGKMVQNTMDLMLPNYAVPKDNTLFENDPKRPLLKDVEIITPCNIGFNAASVGAITLTGHVVQMPAEIITRYDLNPKLRTPAPGVTDGVLTGFTTFNEGKISGIFAGRFKRNSRKHVGYFSLDATEFNLTTSYRFLPPVSSPVRIYSGKDYNSIKEIDNCTELVNVYEALVTPRKTFVAQPEGEMITNILDAVDKNPFNGEPIKVYPICGHQLKSVLPAFTSLDQVTAYVVYNHASLGTGVMYQLNNPNRDWIFAQKKGDKTYYFFWNCYLASWMELPPNSVDADDAEKIAVLHEELEDAEFRAVIHGALAVAEVGLTFICPIVGVIVAGADIVLYTLEDDIGNAAVGVAGLAIGFAPQIGKAIKVVGGALKGWGKSINFLGKIACATGQAIPVRPNPELRTTTKKCLRKILEKIPAADLRNLIQKFAAETSDELTTNFLKLLEETKGAYDLVVSISKNPDNLKALAQVWNEVHKIPELLADNAKLIELLNDLAKNEGLLKAMGGNVGMVRAWEVLSSSSAFRISFNDLDVIEKYLRLFPNKYQELRSGFLAAANKEAFLAKVLAGFYTQQIKWGILDVDVRPFGKGFLGRRTPQEPRVDAYELLVNPNNESFFLPHPNGGFVQFENIVAGVLKDGKLVKESFPNSIYHVLQQPEFLRNSILQPAIRQLEAANKFGYQVEWLVSDQRAVDELRQFFADNNVSIIITHLPE